MHFFRRSVPFLLGSAMAWGATNGCSGGPSPSTGDTADHVGTIGLDLQIGSTTLDTVAYTVTGPSSFTKTGTIDVGQSSTVSAVIGGLPAGSGYAISLTGTASDGVTTCAGSATFNVVASQTTSIAIHLTCHEGPHTGGIIITGTVNVCPVIDGLSASPASARVGNTIAVSAVAHDSDHGPSALSYAWTTTSGTLSGAASPNPTLTCATAGPATLTLTLADGDNAAGCPAVSSITVNCEPAPALSQVGHIIVIYQENHSFDNLFGSWPGAEGLSSPTANIPQIDLATGLPYALLPQVDPNVPATLPNQPFDITQFVPANQKTVDLVHRFYQEQQQIDGGKMDKFVTVSDAKGLSFGYYPTAVQPIAALMSSMPDQVALCDHFFHAAFGGSFLNHHWLIAAASPTFPGAPAAITATLDAQGNLVKDGQVTPDGFVVNTSFTVNAPHPATVPAANLVPNQTNPTIGDRLSDAGVDWAWYAGGWSNALAGTPDPLFQFHHQPFAFYASLADGTAAKAAHLKDEADFMAGVAAGNLPPVSFIKPLGPNNEHPGYADLVTGQNHVVGLIQSVMASPLWSDTVIIVTYDEHGGFWDHVAPPIVDRWGPGARVPAIIFSPFAKKGVDKTSYDTTAILKLIERRYSLPALSTRDAAQADLASNALQFAPPAGGAGGAGGAGDGTPDAGSGGEASTTPTKADVQTILSTHCTICHAGPGAPRGLDLTDVSVVVGATAGECSGKARIVAGNSHQSYLVDKILGAPQDGGCFAGARMPAGGPYLDPSDIALIAAWIDAGAM